MLDDIYDEVFRLMEDMERNYEHTTIPDLMKKISDLAASKEHEGYSLRYLKKKHVEEDFKEKIVIAKANWNLML